MAIKLIAVDMDGTLLLDDHTSVSERNVRALCKAMEQGVLVVPASGRMLTFLPEQVRNLPGVRYAVTSNGAAAHDLETGEKIYTDYLPLDLVEKIVAAVPASVTMLEVYVDGKSYTSRECYENIPNYRFPPEYGVFLLRKRTVVDDIMKHLRENKLQVEKINLPHQAEPLHTELWNQLEAMGGLALVSSQPNNIEINAAGTNKGAALVALCKHLGIPMEDVMALGDSWNDLDMLRLSGFPVAMANAEERVKKVARVVTASYLEDGVAQAVEKYVLHEEG